MLITELQAGNGIVAYVDAIELWRTPNLLQRALIATGLFGYDNSVENHALWITGVDVSDPDNPKVIINDSGQEDGRAKEYPLKDFLAAFEDSEFLFQATGESSPDPNNPERIEIANTIRDFLVETRTVEP